MKSSSASKSAVALPVSEHPQQQPRLSSYLLAVRLGLALVALLLGVLFVQFEWRQSQENTTAQLQQVTKAMEKQTGASLDAIQGLLLVQANTGRSPIDAKAPGMMSPILAGVVRGFPQLRSLSVLSPGGQILASTTADNVGHSIDMALLHNEFRDQSRVYVGGVLSGRDLIDLKPAGTDASKSNVFPMVLHVTDENDTQLVLLALINADYFTSQYESITIDKRIRVGLASFEGQLMATTGNLDRAPGSSLRQLPIFSQYLPQRESGGYVGQGIDNPNAFVAFSTLRNWPVVMVVEYAWLDAMEGAARVEQWVVLVVLLVWVSIALLTWLNFRNSRRHVLVNANLAKEVYATQARSNAVLESSMDGVITIDSRGHIVTFNPAAERMFGRTKQECLGQSMSSLLVPGDLRGAHHAGLDQAIARHRDSPATRLNRRTETTALHSNGSRFPVELSIVSVDIGEQLFFTANVRDISAQKLAAQNVMDLLAKYSAVASDLEQQKLALDQHAIVSIVDESDHIIYANDKLVNISGYSREELLGKKFYTFRNTLAPVVYAQMRAHLDAGKIWNGELHMRHRNGNSYWVANTSVPVFVNDGQVRQYINIQTDVTDFRRTENALKEARERELSIGSRIQQSLLAATVQTQLSNLWLSHYNQASKGIDGDFIDIIALGERCVDVIVGDVMGKGVPAALLGAATKLQFSRSLAELLAHSGRDGVLPQPRDIVASVHHAMTPHLQALDSFVTLAYLRIDIENGMITWVGCGHEESVVVRSTGESILLPNQQPPLGVLDTSEYLQGQIPMDSDDVVFLCSDGLPDAVGPDGEFLGRERVNAALRRHIGQHRTPAATLHTVRRELLHSTMQINDDVSLALIMRPVEADARCELPIDLHSMGLLRAFVLNQTRRAGLPKAESAMFELACVEVFTNIVRHARGLLPGAPVEITARLSGTGSDQALVLHIIYLGEAFTPPQETIEPDLSTFPEGGFGMTIIRSACSRVEFLHHEGVNTVRMTRTVVP